MFLRKIFSSNNKFIWVIIDLFIVIIGVYCAFLIQNYAENEKNAKESDRIISAMKYEMESFRFVMTEISAGMNAEAKRLSDVLAETTFTNFSNSRFIEPQYDYQTIQYALNLQNSAIIDFELYNKLQSLFVEIKKIEHAERLLTETSRRYKTLPTNLDKNSNEFILTWAENYDNFVRYVTLVQDRANLAGRIAIASSEALGIINDRLGPNRAKEIETELMLEYAPNFNNEEQAIYLGKKYFPNFTEEEMREIYRRAKGIESPSTQDTIPPNQ